MRNTVSAKSVLLQLYNGEIAPCEQYAPRIREYHEWYEAFYRQQEGFTEKLRALQPPLDGEFRDLLDEQLVEIPYRTSQTFIDGFCLGVRMMAEVYQKCCTDEEA